MKITLNLNEILLWIACLASLAVIRVPALPQDAPEQILQTTTITLTPGVDEAPKDGRDDDWAVSFGVPHAPILTLGGQSWLSPACYPSCFTNGYAFSRKFTLPFEAFVDLNDVSLSFEVAHSTGISFVDCSINGNYFGRVYNASVKPFVFEGRGQNFYRYGENTITFTVNNVTPNNAVAIRLSLVVIKYRPIVDRNDGHTPRPRLRDVRPRS